MPAPFLFRPPILARTLTKLPFGATAIVSRGTRGRSIARIARLPMPEAGAGVRKRWRLAQNDPYLSHASRQNAAHGAAKRSVAVKEPMPQRNALPGLVFIILFALGLFIAYPSANAGDYATSIAIAVVSFIVASIIANSVKVANQWERVVVLRLGRFQKLAGPGLFFIIPILDVVAYRLDIRVITSTFKAEKTMTRDTVPVDVDAVLFWKVIDPMKAALDVADYFAAINWAAQTALRDVIGKTMLADMLEGRDKLSAELQRIIDARTEPWGINVISVEVKDVQIPAALQDAMSMQAQAERERQARVILGDSERQVAESFNQAAQTYADNPTAFHLRAMNMLYEGLKRSNATIVIVPSTAVESMQLGGTPTLATVASAIAHAKAAGGTPAASSE